MANVRIPQLPVAIGLVGDEELEIAQPDGSGGYVSRRTTSQDIADLALTPVGPGVGTYGSENQVGQFTLDAYGRVVAASNISINNVPIANTTGTLDPDRGGTGLTSYSIGDLIYADGATSLAPIPIGGPGEVLAVNPTGDGYQFIVAAGVGTVTSVGLAAPADFSVTNSPVIAAGTLTLDWAVTPTGTGAMVRATAPTVDGITSTDGFQADPQTEPASPVTVDAWVIFSDTADGDLKAKKSDGTVVNLSVPATTGTVETVAVATANGFAGTSDGDPTNPILTLTTTVTGILQGNGSAISAATVTGTGDVVLATSPTLVTPNLGTPTAINLANATNLPVASISGLGTGVAAWLATPSSANLKAAVTDETGSGALVFANTPTLVTPVLGAATATSINKVAITAPASGSTLTIADGKTLTASNTLTFTGTDGTSFSFPATSSAVLTIGNTALIGVGYTFTAYNAGTQSSGTFTPVPANGNYQYITGNGAFTWAAPAADCAITILLTNGASAGSITFSGYTVASGNTGDPLTTTNTNKFLVMINRINGVSTYIIKALQ